MAHPAPSASVLASQTPLWSGQAGQRKMRPMGLEQSDCSGLEFQRGRSQIAVDSRARNQK